MQISNDRFGQTELAMIPDNISQPIIAQMRFQWWKDAVKAVYQVRFSLCPGFGLVQVAD